MKLFFSILGVILAAAALIGGVLAYSASGDRAAAMDLSILESMTRSAKISSELARDYGQISEPTKDVTVDGARQFERILRAGRIDRVKARSLAFNYVYDYREVVKAVRDKFPEHKKWADELDDLLTKIEAASGSL